MMTKLKGFLSGKSLKQLFIISLISCFGLLGNSFVNAQDFWLGLNTSVQGSNWTGASFRLVSYGNFLTNGRYKYFINNPTDNYFVSLSWIDRKLYVILSDGNLNVLNQGFVNCFGLGDYDDDPNGYKGGGCGYQDNISLIPDEFYGSGTFKNPDGFKVVSKLYDSSTYCFIYSDINKQVCFFASSDPYHQLNLFTGSLGFTSNPKPEDFAGSQLANRVGNSPFGNSFINVDTGFVSVIDSKQNIFNTLYRRGYRTQLCYGGFGLNDLFGTGNSGFGNIQISSGATVFDLYDQYGSGKSFVKWYDDNYFDYSYFIEFRDEYEFPNFLGKSKGLIGLGLVRDSYFKGNESDFNSADLRTFCSSSFDENVSDVGISPIGLIDSQLGEEVLNGLIGDIGILIPGSGTALDVLFNQLYSGKCEGTPEECILSGNLIDTIDDSWNAWSIRGLRTGIDGILPKYIVIGFLGILLLYYLRR